MPATLPDGGRPPVVRRGGGDLATGLADACGADHVREATVADAVDGVVPSWVAVPADAGEVAATLRAAAGAGAGVVVRGRGTKMSWGAPPTSADVVVDVSRLAAVVEHAAGDLVVRVQPGVTLADLAAHLAPAGQRLGIDEVVPGSSVGGVLATGLSGPSRLGHGAVRDLLLGVTVVLADGTLTRSGSKVVKNVAGYDLGKLYTGSYGTLGVVVEAIFRLHPLPERAVWVQVACADESGAGAALSAVAGSQVVPAGVEIDRPEPGGPVQVAVAIEGSEAGIGPRVERTLGLLGAGAEAGDEPPPWWGALPGDITVKMTGEISQVPALLGAMRPTGAAVRGCAGVGVIHAGLPASAEGPAVAALLSAARRAAAAAGGSATLLRAPAAVKAGLDVWGPVPALGLMSRVKDVFDPGHRLAPGRFVGGL